MSTTTENGWTKTFPQVEGFYFARRTQTNAPALTIIQIWQYEDEWFAYRFARNDDIEAADFVRSLYEYLGPLYVSDFEQLAALREIAKGALRFRIVMNGPCGHGEYMTKLCTQCEIRQVLAQGEKS